MQLISIPAFNDNYIWLLEAQQKQCLIIDPGQATPVLDALEQLKLTPAAILLTHHHYDHVDGVTQLLEHYPQLPVYGPQETATKGANIIVQDKDNIQLGEYNIQVISVPGHTLGHVAYYTHPYLFCGDTLFSAGCGRLFEGSAEQMYQSLQKIAQLPDDTLICCAHEYTLSNLNFAIYLLPEDNDIKTYRQQMIAKRAKNQPTLPSTLHLERKINLFLRCHDLDLQKKLAINFTPEHIHDVFRILRACKDKF